MPAGIGAFLMELGEKLEKEAKALNGFLYADCELIDHDGGDMRGESEFLVASDIIVNTIISNMKNELDQIQEWFTTEKEVVCIGCEYFMRCAHRKHIGGCKDCQERIRYGERPTCYKRRRV